MNTTIDTSSARQPLDPHGIDVVRELYAAVARGDLAAARAYLADDCVFIVPGTGQNAGTWKGPDGVVAFLTKAFELSGGSLRVELVDVLAGKDHVVALATYRASRPDRAPLENRLAQVIRFERTPGRPLRLSESRFCAYDQYSVDAFWS